MQIEQPKGEFKLPPRLQQRFKEQEDKRESPNLEEKQQRAEELASEQLAQKIAKSKELGSKKLVEAKERKKQIEEDTDYYVKIMWGKESDLK